MTQLHVTIWNEHRHERKDPQIARIYPEGLHAPIAKYLHDEGMAVRVATLDEPEHGLTDSVLAQTEVLTWWGHMAHGDVNDEIVERVHRRVLDGMG
ncbi:MAG: ThuA domain-containing protein, partial [Anaerolineales bacterium]